MTKPRPQKDARPAKKATRPAKKAAQPAKKAAQPAKRAARPAKKAARPPRDARPPREARAPREARPPQEPREAPPREERELPSGPPRSGRVALLGRPNVGKSTLLNAALGHPLAIVSPTPQTTRDAILGVAHHGTAELALLDTPGLHRPLTELGRAMNEAAREAARSADVVVFMAEMRAQQGPRLRIPAPHPGDVALLADLGTDAPVVLVINKIDRVHDKRLLLPLMTGFAKLRDFAAIVPVSALSQDGVDRVLNEVAKLLPEGPWRYAPDELTDRPARFFVAEYVREQILRATQAEVPHASAVQIDRFLEPPAGVVQIDATIHVERPGQKKILIGAGASMLKRIGTQARQRIEELVGRQVNLKLWVRVSPEWRQSARDLRELGYRTPAEAKESMVFAELPDDDAVADGGELIEDEDADADTDEDADADADADADEDADADADEDADADADEDADTDTDTDTDADADADEDDNDAEDEQ